MKDLADLNGQIGAVTWAGVIYKTILDTADTGGAMSIVDTWSPAGSGPPRHVHHAEDEVFILLSGRTKIWLEGEEFIREAGEAVFIPRGKEHTFRVTDDGPSRHIIILTPGGFEGFFYDMADGQYRIPDDMPQIVESAERNNLTFTGPPLEG